MLKETIIVTSNVNEGEKLKSLASFGKKTFNTRYLNTYNLALYLLQKSGVSYKERFIKDDELVARLYTKIKEITYFEKYTFNDMLNLIKSVNDLRHYIVDNEQIEILDKLPVDKFVQKNQAVKAFYILLTKNLKENDLIDELGVIRLALEHTKTFKDINFVIYENDKITQYPLDMALLHKASGKDIKPVSIYDRKVEIKSYTKAFSQVNEIENILNYIYKNNIPFDQCLIAGAETKDYSTILTNYHDLLGFPLSIGVGKNIINSNPGRLFSLLCEWKESHFYPDLFKKILVDNCFNYSLLKEQLEIDDEKIEELNKDLKYPELISIESIVDTVSELRLCFDKAVNDKRIEDYTGVLIKNQNLKRDKESTNRRLKELDYVVRFKEILDKGQALFIKCFANIVDDVDSNALEKILRGLWFENKYKVEPNDIVKAIFNQDVSHKPEEKGKLYFTSIDRAVSCLRPYLFIVGLSSSNYPGANKEDPNLFDRDYEPFGVKEASNRTINNNKNSYTNLIKEASSLGVNIHLSYAFYNSMTLKTQNASSVVFETYRLENGKEKTIKDFEDEFINNKDKYKTIEFFETDLLAIAEIARTIKDGNKVSFTAQEVSNTGPVSLKDEIASKALSASAVHQFTECQYSFFLSRILKVPQKEDIDIFTLIPSNDLGTLAHSLLEDLDYKTTSREQFLDTCKDRYLDYFKIHFIDNEPLLKVSTEEFLEMMKNAYEMGKYDYKTLLKEEDLYCKHEETGLMIHGLPDKVIRNSNGDCYVVDYKTGRTLKHFTSDLDSLIQCIFYCYILQHKKHYPMAGFVFRYLRLNHKVESDRTMQEYYDHLDNVLRQIKACYDTGVFEPNGSCTYCYFKDVCPRKHK